MKTLGMILGAIVAIPIFVLSVVWQIVSTFLFWLIAAGLAYAVVTAIF